jgi:hypothetical protein
MWRISCDNCYWRLWCIPKLLFFSCLIFASINGLIIPVSRFFLLYLPLSFIVGGRRDRMVVGFKTTCAISVYHHKSCKFESRSRRGVFHTTLCDKVCQWLVTGRWFSSATPSFSTKNADRHYITEILLIIALNPIVDCFVRGPIMLLRRPCM